MQTSQKDLEARKERVRTDRRKLEAIAAHSWGTRKNGNRRIRKQEKQAREAQRGKDGHQAKEQQEQQRSDLQRRDEEEKKQAQEKQPLPPPDLPMPLTSHDRAEVDPQLTLDYL